MFFPTCILIILCISLTDALTLSPQNQYSITLNYTYALVSHDIGVKVRVNLLDIDPSYKDQPWSYFFTYPTAYQLTPDFVKTDWSYGIYNQNMFAFIPPQSNSDDTLEFFIRNLTAIPNLNDFQDIAIPQTSIIIPSRTLSSTIVGFPLAENIDYQVVNDPSIITPSDYNLKNDTNIPIEMGNPANSNDIDGALSQYNDRKHIPGNPNFDATMNPYGIDLVGPLVGLWVYSIISVIGISSYLYGSYFRLKLKGRYYQMLQSN
ncbi:hypothetical protein BB559_002983 [Furculomyces boomerangus]|uniref:Protein PBN1 n=1 Tax=Furculomyces boomerangus TaxID=61424 RepID=A0A2T9YQ78_9FUNG|nr:hypothetical protein BB559_002983 [Furculomyces boomerangus]